MSQKAVTDAIRSGISGTVVQTTGDSGTLVMSQKAVTDVLRDRIQRATIMPYSTHISINTKSNGTNPYGEIIFPKNTLFIFGDQFLELGETTTIPLTQYTDQIFFRKTGNLGSDGRVVVGEFIKIPYYAFAQIDLSNDFYVCSITQTYIDACDLSVPYYLNGKFYGGETSILHKPHTPPLTFGAFLPTYYTFGVKNPFLKIDSVKKTLSIEADTLLLDYRLPSGYVSFEDKQFGSYPNVCKQTCDFSACTSSAICIWYEISSNQLIARNYAAEVSHDDNVLIACYRSTNKYAFSSIPVMVDDKLYGVADDSTDNPTDAVISNIVNNNIKSVNHRGYSTVAPENTLAAYRLSKQKGFEYVECDVQFTADNVPVLLHDGNVDRTSNGTGHINTLRFEEVRALDFGSWMSEDYAGEKIPSLEEFIKLCRNLGLHPYIELKGLSVAQVQVVIDTVKRCGMRDKVTYISFYENTLNAIKSYDSSARLGYVTESRDSSIIETALALKTDTNEVFLDIANYSLTNENIELAVAAGLPIEVWTVNDATAIINLDPYVTGVTSDNLIAGNVLYEANM